MTARAVIINRPGVYDIPVDQYHRDPVPGGSLSSSGARKLLPPSCPAKFKHWLSEGQPPSREFDFGHAAHREVLGAGPQLVVVDAADYRTKAAQTARDEAYAAGAVPVLAGEYEVVRAMAAALRAHPIASALLDPSRGRPEQTLVWLDATGVWCRGLVDHLPYWEPDRRLIISDYKSCRSAAPEDLRRCMHSYGYHQQLDWYLAGAEALNLAGAGQQPAGVFIFQEKTPPYLVTVAQPDRTALDIARTRNRKALAVYRTCADTGTWPAYADDVIDLALPGWAENQFDVALERGDFDITEEN